MALSANSTVPMHSASTAIEDSRPVLANAHIWRGSFVEITPNGYLKPFAAGGQLYGIARHEFYGGATDGAVSIAGTEVAAGIANCCVMSRCDRIYIAVSGVVASDIGRYVYATDDNTVSLSGNPYGKIGRILDVPATGYAWVDFRTPGVPDQVEGSIFVDNNFANYFTTTTGASTRADGNCNGLRAIGKAASGSPTVSFVQEVDGYAKLLLASTSEAEFVGILTGHVFNVTNGIRCYFKGRLATAGNSTDTLFLGIGSLASGLTDTEFANPNATTSGLKSANFNIVTNANDVLAASDNNTTVVSATDTTIDNSLTVDNEYIIIARTSGSVEFWANVAGAGWSRVLSSTTFDVSTSGLFAVYAILAKSAGTGVPDVRINRLIAAGAGA